MTALLFAAATLIWGTTWFAIALQVGPVPALTSVFYRFALAAAIFLAGLALTGRLKVPPRAQHPWIALQALFLFSFNFLCFYNAEAFVPSGLVSVVFSLATIFNALNARIFFGDRITPRVLLASGLGIAGLVLLFGRDVLSAGSGDWARGLGLAVLGTLLFSLGNMVSRRNSAAGIAPATATAWGMGYGALVLLGLIALTGTPVVAPPTPSYAWALIYLAVFGSILGFTAYLTLIARIGSARAAYTTVLYPIVALTISTFFEGYQWHWSGVAGLGLALAGNLVMFAPRFGLSALRVSRPGNSQ